MKVTKQLKRWLIDQKMAEEGMTDDEFRAAAGKAMAEGKLAPEEYFDLTKEEKEDEASYFTKRLDALVDQMAALTKKMNEKSEDEKSKDEKSKDKKDEKKIEDEKKNSPPSRMAKAIASLGGMEAITNKEEADKEIIDVRVKRAVESYVDTKSVMTYPKRSKHGRRHPLADQPVKLCSRVLDEPSERDQALAGVWAKFQLMSITPRWAGTPDLAWAKMTEHEKCLLASLAEDYDWDASKDGKDHTVKGYPGGIKQLIDDATSGGLEAAPIVFDDQVIQTPLLHGELFPLVNVIPLSRGRRIEAVETGTVTGSWGGVDDTAVTLFTTTSYVSAFDNTIFRWEGAIRIGLDFLSDTPIDFNAHVTAQYGQRLLEDLDDVIATGDGTTQPEGVINKSGVTSVTWSSTTSIGNYESLRFSVAKPEHRGMENTAVFCGTETSYQRAKAIPVASADARRLFAGGSTNVGTYDDYALMNRKYAINESLTNSQVFYAILGRYRMYRRKGLTVRTSTEGDTLIRRNEMLIVVMARYGGALERGACAGVVTDAPA